MTPPPYAHCPAWDNVATNGVVSARFIPGVPVPNPFQPIQDAINNIIRRVRQLLLGMLIYFVTGIKNAIIYGFVIYHFDPDI